METPPLVQRLIDQLLAQGRDEGAAREIAVAALTKAGNLDARGELTAQGVERQNRGAEGRAIDRARKRAKVPQPEQSYRYSEETNRATLRKETRK